MTRTAGRLAAAAGPALATLYLAFNAGGFFAGAPAVVATALGVALVLRITLADDPFAGFGPWLMTATVGLGLYTAWTLASALWSDAPAQAMIEFNRALMYWLALVLFGSLPRDRRTLLWAIRGVAMALVFIGLAGLTTHLAPDVWEAPVGLEAERLNYPLTYWNALGILVAVAIVLCAGISTRRGEPWPATVLASAALPALAATLYFSFSRGGIVAALTGLLAYSLLVRSRYLLSVVLATAPPTLVALLVCYRAEVLANPGYGSPAWISAGHEVAAVVAVCALVAGLIRLVLLRFFDSGLERVSLSARGRRIGTALAAVGAGIALIAGAITLDAPARVSDQYERFVDRRIGGEDDLRGRLTDIGNNGRLVQWRFATEIFAESPMTGEGAGTFARTWARDGTGELKVEDAHSLYLEVLAELGLPGLLFLAAAFVGLFGGLISRLGGPDRPIHGALLAAGFVWAAHAGIDWDWEMPATALWLFALGGVAIARPGGAPALPTPGRLGRAALGIGCLALIVTPALMALSQGKLNSAAEALKVGNCRAASEDALAAIGFVSVRPEPYQVLGFCNTRAGEHRLAVAMMETAIARDPENWVSHYGLALVRGAGGEDPRPAARRALDLNPHNQLARDGVERFGTEDPGEWRRRALGARLPIH